MNLLTDKLPSVASRSFLEDTLGVNNGVGRVHLVIVRVAYHSPIAPRAWIVQIAVKGATDYDESMIFSLEETQVVNWHYSMIVEIDESNRCLFGAISASEVPAARGPSPNQVTRGLVK